MAVSQIKLVMEVPTDLVDQVKAVMEDEFEIACSRWKAYPTDEQKEKIFEHSFAQLKLRVNNFASDKWGWDSPTLTVSVSGPRAEIKLSSPEAATSPLRLVRSRDTWVIDNDKSDNSIGLTELPQAVVQEILTWGRSAVFYGVGSYRI